MSADITLIVLISLQVIIHLRKWPNFHASLTQKWLNRGVVLCGHRCNDAPGPFPWVTVFSCISCQCLMVTTRFSLAPCSKLYMMETVVLGSEQGQGLCRTDIRPVRVSPSVPYFNAFLNAAAVENDSFITADQLQWPFDSELYKDPGFMCRQFGTLMGRVGVRIQDLLEQSLLPWHCKLLSQWKLLSNNCHLSLYLSPAHFSYLCFGYI